MGRQSCNSLAAAGLSHRPSHPRHLLWRVPYQKTIVCLANSRKWQGRCVAGLEWNGTPGAWIRPVGAGEKGVINGERFCPNASGRDPQLLDLVTISFVAPQPHDFQIENQLIVPQSWTYSGSVKWQDLLPAVEYVKGQLWANVGHSRNGQNDMIPEEVAPGLKCSLKLVQPEELTIKVTMEGRAGAEKRKLRGEFSLYGYWYTFSVTDSRMEQELKTCAPGAEKVFRNPLLCLSLSEVLPDVHACYKLIAGVVPTE